MSTFTSSLPDDLLKRLSDVAEELSMPKNKLIEHALRIYLEQIKKAAYVKSYSRMASDTDVLRMVEEGLQEYYIQLNQE